MAISGASRKSKFLATLLPADFDTLDMKLQDKAISEALSYIAEMEVLRTRKRAVGDKSVNVAPAIISRNLLALSRLAPGATKKFRPLIEAARGIFGLTSARTLALKAGIREGRINESDYEAFMDKMTGRNLQAEQDGMVRDEQAALLGQEAFTPTEDAPFSLVPGGVSTLLSMNAIMADSSAFDGTKDSGELRKIGEKEYAKLVGQEPVNVHDGRKFEFTLQQFGKPKSHSADPRIMKLIPSLPELLKNAVLLDTESEVDQTKYRNIDAWHTYGVRAVLDGQPLFVQLSTFEQNGVEMVGLYHDHNVLSEEAFQWGQKNSEKQSSGPTDPVTNRAVTLDALAKSKMYQLLTSVKTPEFSLSPAAQIESLSLNAASKIKDPRVKAGMFERLVGKLGELKRDRDEYGVAFGKGYTRKAIEDPRKTSSINKEAAFREAARRSELEDAAYAKHQGIIENEDLAKLKSQPVHQYLADPDSPLKGLLMSKSQAISRGENFFDEKKQGDYDGAGNASRSIFGGQMAPDTAAQELYDNGLIKEPTADAMWQALEKEQAGVAKFKEYQKAAAADMKAARDTAKAEAKDWKEKRMAEEKANYSPKARLLRSMAALDAIISVLPISERGRITGHKRLAELETDEARLKYLNNRIDQVEKVIDVYLAKEFTRMLDKLLDRALPPKGKPGEKPKGKAGADVHSLFDKLREARGWNATDTRAQVDKIEGILAAGEIDTGKGKMRPLTSDEVAHLTLEAGLVDQVGNWKDADNTRRAAAIKNATEIFDRGYAIARLAKLLEKESQDIRRKQLQKNTGTKRDLTARQEKATADDGLTGGAAKGRYSFASIRDVDHQFCASGGLLGLTFDGLVRRFLLDRTIRTMIQFTTPIM